MKRDHSPKRADASPDRKTPAGAPGPSPKQLFALAERLAAVRHRRTSVLADEKIAEPGWDILTALYRAQAGKYRLSVSNALRATASPASTARRWLERLEELGLIAREKDASDGRIVHVNLSPPAKRALDDYLVEMWVTLHAED